MEKQTQQTEQHEKKAMSLDDVVNDAQEKGLKIPAKSIDFMRQGVEEKKITIGYVKLIVDRSVKMKAERNLSWNDVENPEAGKAVAKYGTKDHKTQAYILELQNKESGKTFYAANRIVEVDGKTVHEPMKTSSFKDSLKNYVDAVYTNEIMQEVRNDLKKEFEEKKQERQFEGAASGVTKEEKKVEVEIEMSM